MIKNNTRDKVDSDNPEEANTPRNAPTDPKQEQKTEPEEGTIRKVEDDSLEPKIEEKKSIGDDNPLKLEN